MGGCFSSIGRQEQLYSKGVKTSRAQVEKGGMMAQETVPPGFEDMLNFGLLEALLGRRSRRFFSGAKLPDGVFAYKSQQDVVPLSELEKLLVVTACGGNTGWYNMIYRAQRYAPKGLTSVE